MGDRFYQQQNEYFKQPRDQKKMTEKKVRRLKKDAIAELNDVIVLPGIDRLTIANIDGTKEIIIEMLAVARDEGYNLGYGDGGRDCE